MQKKSLQSYTILYIEDDLEIRGYFSEFLKRYYTNIYECSNTKDGRELYDKYSPEILLLDINLPGASGINFASLIRDIDKDVRIIMLTAYTNTEFMLEAVELNITRYLVKPVSGDELLEALKKAAQEFKGSEKNTFKMQPLGQGFIYSMRDKTILKDNKVVVLRKKEIELLEFFLENKNKIISYNRFENELWYKNGMSEDSIRAQIKNIRAKTYHDFIENISKVGYRCVISS